MVAKLRKQKAVLLGHTTCSERSGDINGLFAGNAWDMRYACGGSSQGSGVAPIARLAAAAIGVETGGSIVVPAAANGASAIKPAPGTVSAAGVMQGQAGMDVPGPMARSVRDAALILNAMYDRHSNPAGPDGDQSPASVVPTSPSPGTRPLNYVRIGVPLRDWMSVDGSISKDCPYNTYEAEHRAAYDRFKLQLTSLGAEVVEFDSMDDGNHVYHTQVFVVPGINNPLPLTPSSVLYHYNSEMVNQAEHRLAFANGRSSAQRAAMGVISIADEFTVQRASLVDLRHQALSERARHRFRKDYQQKLDEAQVDFMLVLPLGARVRSRFHSNYLPVARSDHALPNLLGWPMVVFLIGMTPAEIGPDGEIPQLPISAAFWGPAFAERLIIQAAIDFQAHFPEYHTQAPGSDAANHAEVHPTAGSAAGLACSRAQCERLATRAQCCWRPGIAPSA